MLNFNENALTRQPTLYLFLDESGNFDFSPKGTKFFILTGLATFDPVIKRGELIRLRYKLLSEGDDQEYFHATEDRQAVRDEVFSFLASLGDTYEIHAIAARKNRTHPSLYKEHYIKGGRLIERVTGIGLYKTLCECILGYIFRGNARHAGKIVVVVGSLFVGDKKKTLLQTLKHFLKNNFSGVPFEIYSHKSCADLNCQLADYCCWAISVYAERNEKRPYQVIRPQVKSVFDIFKSGETEYYQYSASAS